VTLRASDPGYVLGRAITGLCVLLSSHKTQVLERLVYPRLMKLEEYKEILVFDHEVTRIGEKAFKETRISAKDSPYDLANKFRSKFRAKTKKLADTHTQFSGTRNGTSSFNEWQDGFKFAISLPAGTEMVKYVKFNLSPNACFFYTKETFNNITKFLDEYYIKLEELKKLIGVFEVMTS
jgi:hypothetical protein